MSIHRELKRQARRDLHDKIADTVLYLPVRDSEPQTIKVRLHVAFSDGGGLGSSDGWAERHDITPKARFMGTVPVKNGLIVTEDMGVFSIDNTFPPNDITQDAEITKLSAGQARSENLDITLPWCGLPAPTLLP
jgi:hypothetical protein